MRFGEEKIPHHSIRDKDHNTQPERSTIGKGGRGIIVATRGERQLDHLTGYLLLQNQCQYLPNLPTSLRLEFSNRDTLRQVFVG